MEVLLLPAKSIVGRETVKVAGAAGAFAYVAVTLDAATPISPTPLRVNV